MAVTATAVKTLREMTGAGFIECKKALEESDGDIDVAAKALVKAGVAKGMALSTKRGDSDLNQGLIESYTHAGGRVGSMVELNCATDFVARTDEFKALAHDIAMQVAAMNPQFVNVDDAPADFPGSREDAALLEQPFIRDQSKAIRDLLAEAIGKLGENIRIRRFSRFELDG